MSRLRITTSPRARPALLLLALIMASGPAAAPTAPVAQAPKSLPRPAHPASSATRTPVTCLSEALGGIEHIARVSSLYTRYQIEVGGLKGTSVFWRSARGAQRESLDVPGAFSELVVFDGRQGWRRGPSGTVLPMSGVDLENVVTEAFLGSYMHLVPGRIRGKVERLGLDRAAGLVKLRVKPEGGVALTLFLDTLTCLPAKIQRPAGEQTLTSTFRDWRDVGGIKLPFSVLMSTGDPRTESKLTLLEARFDAPLPPRAFTKPVPVGPQPRIADSLHSVELPFELVSNKPFIDVRLDGSPPMRFLFDTGSPGMLIDMDRAKAIGLKLEGQFQTGGAGEGSLEQAFAKSVDVAIGALEAPKMNFAVAPLKGSSPAEGCELSGLVGYDLACHFVVNVDYEAGRFRFFDPDHYAYRGAGASVPYSLIYGGLMLVSATIALPAGDSLTGRFIVDTGVRLALTLNRPFAEKHRLAERLPAGPEGAVGYGLGGETRGRITRAKALRIGGLVFNDPVTALSLDKGGVLASSDFDGIIGGELLRRCNVIFDHPRQRMILEPNAAFATPFDYDMSGTFLLARGDDFRRFEVWRVLDNSPATEAGLKEGDIITRLDGRPAAELTLEEIRRALRAEGREVELGIQRGDQALTVRLKLRRLV